jgi:DNA primase
VIPATEIDAIRSRVSLRELIGRDVSLKRVGQYWLGSCPFHSPDAHPSFAVIPSDQRFRCYACGATGDAIEYLRRTKGLDFHQAVAQLSSAGHSVSPGLRPPARRAAGSLPGIPKHVGELWAGADAPRIAEFYLQSRGLLRRGALPAALRGHSRVLYSEPCGEVKPIVEPSWRTWRDPDGQWWKAQHRPAILAAVTDTDGQITALQRIWCERRYVVDASQSGPQDARAVGIAARKKTIGRLGNGAVRLAPAGPTLGLAEGVESALAAAALFRVPVWATCGSGRLHSIALPACVERVLIFADRGAAGEAAAERAIAAYSPERLCSAVFPEPRFGDFNDQLLGRGK